MSTLKKDYINLRNKYKDNTQCIYQQDYVQFLYKFYIENGKKCSSPDEFVEGFYYTRVQTVFGLQKSDRDLSNVKLMLDRHFNLTTIHNATPIGSKGVGEFLIVVE